MMNLKEIKTKQIVFIFLLILVAIPVYILVLGSSGSPSTDSPMIGQPTSDGSDLFNSTTALQEGVKGIVVLNLEKGTQTPINTTLGVDKEFIITAKFISYDPKITETILKLNPQDPSFVVEKGLGPGLGTIRLNDLIKYNATLVRLPANEEVKIMVTINVPLGTPNTYIQFQPVGISSDYTITSNIQVDINV